MNRVFKANIMMFVGLIVNVGLIIFPFAVLYDLALGIYLKMVPEVLLTGAVMGKFVFNKIKNDEYTGTTELFLGVIGGVIAVKTVNRGYGGKENVYIVFWRMIWLLAVYPLVFRSVIRFADVVWLPSV